MSEPRLKSAGATEPWERQEIDAESYELLRELLAKTHPGFAITCENCQSTAVGVNSDVGFSPVSGAWGGVTLACAVCGRKAEIWSPA